MKEMRTIKLLFTIVLILMFAMIAVFVWFISDASRNNSTNTNIQYMGKGERGLSAYQLAVIDGFKGGEKEWLSSLKGDNGITKVVTEKIETKVEVPTPKAKDGVNGKDGKSAYEVWTSVGNTGTEADFIESLKPIPSNVTLELRLNEATGNIQTKLSKDKLWKNVPKCGIVTPCN